MKILIVLLAISLASGFMTYVAQADYSDTQDDILTQRMAQVNELVGSKSLQIVMVNKSKYPVESK